MARQSQAPILLLTRPQPQSERFAAEALAALGALRIAHSPLLAPEFLAPPLPERPFRAVILSSETAAQAARRISAPLPRLAYVVGDRTAAAAQAAGFEAISAQGDAEALIALIKATGEVGPLLHLKGEKSRGAIEETLISAGIETVSAVIYRQITQALTPEAERILAGSEPVFLSLFSPETAAQFLRSLPCTPKAPLHIAAMSPAVAAILPPALPRALRIAAHPDAASMIDALRGLIDAGALS